MIGWASIAVAALTVCGVGACGIGAISVAAGVMSRDAEERRNALADGLTASSVGLILLSLAAVVVRFA